MRVVSQAQMTTGVCWTRIDSPADLCVSKQTRFTFIGPHIQRVIQSESIRIAHTRAPDGMRVLLAQGLLDARPSQVVRRFGRSVLI